MNDRFHNTFTVTGEDKRIEQIRPALMRTDALFETFAPVPAGLTADQQIMWKYNAWGPRNNPTSVSVDEDKTTRIVLSFETIQIPPNAFLRNMTVNNKRLNFKLDYYQINGRVRGQIIGRGGRIRRDRAWNMTQSDYDELGLGEMHESNPY